MNNYVSWVYSELLKKIQSAETNISTNSDDIYRINGFVGFDGQLMYSLNLANEQIPENSDLNDYTMTGTYYCTGTSVATTIANSPTTYNYKMVVEFITASYVQQTVQAEYVETYNKYMTLPDDSKELKALAKKLQELEEILTRRFLFESGYTLEKVGDSDYNIYIKDGQ